LPNRVVVLNYKTEDPVEVHLWQIKSYANLYRQMGYKNVDALLVYIERNEVVMV